MKKVLLLAVVVSISVAGFAQNTIEGVWLGGITFNGMTLRIAFHVNKTPEGLKATMDSIDQGAKGIPVTSVAQDGDNVTIVMQAIGGDYKGKMDASGKVIEGTWSQGGGALPLQLKRVDESALEIRRPQNPTKPYPYREEEVTFENKAAGIKLAGTLTLPNGKGPFTAVVLITGSGPQNRDEELLGHRPFLVLSDYLTRKGIAVLRVDDRGIGQSQGKYAEATTADFATDVEAAVAFLKTRAEVNTNKIGLIGHSEGGTIGSMVAARNSDVAFLVMMAGSSVPGSAIIPEQARAIAKANGAPAEKCDEVARQERAAIDIVLAEPENEAAKKKLQEKLAGWMPQERIGPEIATLTSPWFRYFLSYDPATALRKVKCPLLALNGSLDLQILAAQNLPPLREALQQAGNKQVEIVELPGLNHLFQTAKTGSVAEYSQIEETISPTALEKIASWVAKR